MSGFNLSRAALLGSVAIIGVVAPLSIVQAQSAAREYNVPAQAAQSGLQTLGAQSGLQIIAPQPDLMNKRINAVEGRMDAQAALRKAIANTGLEVVSNNGAVVVLRAAQTKPATPSAQPVVAHNAAAEVIEEVTVVATPIQYSLRKSIQAQRNATNVVNVIASDTIGRFPDQTAAAALSRLPGVAVQRDQGQERYVQVRGAPARWSSVAFNGVAILGAEDRVFRFDSVPSALIGQLNLNKTLDASMPAESLAGYIDIKTYSALANPGFHGQADLGSGFVDLGDGPQTQYSGRVSWANDKFGVVLAGSHFAFEQQTDNAEPRYDATGVSQLRTAKYVIQRETNSLSAALEYAPAAGHKLSFTTLYNEFIDDEERNQYTFYFNGGTGTRNFQTANLTGVEVRGLFNKGGQETSVLYNVAHGEHNLNGWILDWDIGHHKSVLESGSPLIEQFQSAGQRPGVSYVLGEGNIPTLTLFNPVAQGGGQRTSLDQMAFSQERITWSGSKRETTDKIVHADVFREWTNFGAAARFKAGIHFNDRKFTDVGSYANVTPAGGTGIFDARVVSAALGVEWNPNSFVQLRPVDEDFSRGFTFNYIDNAAMRARSEALINAARAANASGANYAVPQLSPSQRAEIKEKMTSAYAMNTWQWQTQMLQIGLRAEKVETTSTGTATINGVAQPIVIDNEFHQGVPQRSLEHGRDPRCQGAGRLCQRLSPPIFRQHVVLGQHQ
ncbi:TonB-dependent receptor plug domain-containing protein [Asticcacaulis sp. ZE23SCel15]|uniref:TonB-dependent receptor n=1 Tax=Asticcacaulis sp. ZE23SCel15 TaxID=3059027 RepID=UPI00265FF620|nr:TonB-dependent receptor [Asticcacaulis sp. ZE23SCel15]WKL56067.1 TonB-dependent receptor plug domain-containing protein [Asticcacaulis sp. ZE23SCel15]